MPLNKYSLMFFQLQWLALSMSSRLWGCVVRYVINNFNFLAITYNFIFSFVSILCHKCEHCWIAYIMIIKQICDGIIAIYVTRTYCESFLWAIAHTKLYFIKNNVTNALCAVTVCMSIDSSLPLHTRL